MRLVLEVEHTPFPDLLREADRGRFTAAPASIPAKGWRDVFWRVAYNVIDDRVLPLAGGVAYYALLAVFPAVGNDGVAVWPLPRRLHRLSPSCAPVGHSAAG
ncbi:MAG TPA: hypothetical protein VF014_10855 [Casimicrobiaceae bacterium]|nr:hypothetical protein [Casimicrobiaceae bacterium]